MSRGGVWRDECARELASGEKGSGGWSRGRGQRAYGEKANWASTGSRLNGRDQPVYVKVGLIRAALLVTRAASSRRCCRSN